jgi:NAD(P)-dependent dehydrogenase (short-subunit alcohol dehydrogenase family)
MSKSRGAHGRRLFQPRRQGLLVTGGASGIGATIARRFAQQNSNVVFFDIKADEGQSLAGELSDHGLSAHCGGA